MYKREATTQFINALTLFAGQHKVITFRAFATVVSLKKTDSMTEIPSEIK